MVLNEFIQSVNRSLRGQGTFDDHAISYVIIRELDCVENKPATDCVREAQLRTYFQHYLGSDDVIVELEQRHFVIFQASIGAAGALRTARLLRATFQQLQPPVANGSVSIGTVVFAKSAVGAGNLLRSARTLAMRAGTFAGNRIVMGDERPHAEQRFRRRADKRS